MDGAGGAERHGRETSSVGRSSWKSEMGAVLTGARVRERMNEPNHTEMERGEKGHDVFSFSFFFQFSIQ